MRAATGARAYVWSARTGVSLLALIAALATAGMAAPARAGGNDDDQDRPPTRLTIPYRDPVRPIAPRRHRDAPDGVQYETIVIGGEASSGVSVDMTVLDDLLGPPPRGPLVRAARSSRRSPARRPPVRPRHPPRRGLRPWSRNPPRASPRSPSRPHRRRPRRPRPRPRHQPR